MKKRKADSSQINLLDLVPVRTIQSVKSEKSLMVLLKPKFKHPLLAKHLLPRMKNPHFKVKLDEIGSFIWNQCDGEKTVKEIAANLKNAFGENIEPLYERLGLFLQNLEKNRFITYKNL